MPIRSSVCAYSPLAAAASTNSSKYSSMPRGNTSGSSRFLASTANTSSVLPSSSLSCGHYKPLSSSISDRSSRFSSSGSSSLLSTNSSSSSTATGPLSRYNTSSSPSSYSPTVALSSSSGGGGGSSRGLYRPLTGSTLSPVTTQRSSFNANNSYSTPTSSSSRTRINNYHQPSSLSNSSLSSAYSSDYLRPSSSSAYSSASISSSSTSSTPSSQRYYTADHYSSPRARRLSYTSHSSLSSLGSGNYQVEVDHTNYLQQQQLPDGVPNGLINLGNTCYMNATLQALYSIDLFRNLITSSAVSMSRPNYNSSDNSKLLTSELCELFTKMKETSSRTQQQRTTTSPLNPANFKHSFSNFQTKFSGLGQQDAQEFLRYLINGIHEESNRANRTRATRNQHSALKTTTTTTTTSHRRSPNSSASSAGGSSCAQPSSPKTSSEAWQRYQTIVDDSPFVDILVGQLCSTITCSQCGNRSHCWDPFWDLSLPLVSVRAGGQSRYSSSECNLLDLLNEFTAKETLDSDVVCEQCKRATKSTKQISLAKMPQVLILHLKKFTNDGYKLSCPNVKIDTVLQITSCNVIYHLKACISHHGHSSSSGHYTSHCEYSNKWFNFDDNRVRDVSGSFNSSKLDDAYVLFYTRQSSTSQHKSKL